MGGWANGQRGVCGGEGDGVDAIEHGEWARGRGRSRSTGEGCVAVRVMVCMPYVREFNLCYVSVLRRFHLN